MHPLLKKGVRVNLPLSVCLFDKKNCIAHITPKAFVAQTSWIFYYYSGCELVYLNTCFFHPVPRIFRVVGLDCVC